MKTNWIKIVIIISVITSLLSLYIFRTPLQAYIDTSDVSNQEEDMSENFSQHSDDSGLQIQIPDTWEPLIIEGHQAFVHQDGTIIEISYDIYYPEINSVSEITVNNQISALGGLNILYQELNSSAYVSIYQLKDVVYAQYIQWTLQTVLTVELRIRADSYDSMTDTLAYIFDSIAWQPEYDGLIPESIRLYYNTFGDFEFAYPTDWSAEIYNGSFICTNNTARITFGVTDILEDLHAISQVDLVNHMNSLYPGFFLKEFVSGPLSLKADGIFQYNASQMICSLEIMQNAEFQYQIQYEAPSESESLVVIRECLNYFRIFD